MHGLRVLGGGLLLEGNGQRGLRALEPLLPFARDRLDRARQALVVLEQESLRASWLSRKVLRGFSPSRCSVSLPSRAAR